MPTSKSLFIACVRAYRLLLAPLFTSFGVQCRFTPSCSEYSIRSLEEHGSWRGIGLTAARLARCHPFCAGGHDPVPPAANRVTNQEISYG